MTDAPLLVPALGLAALLGATAHRAGLCSVRAVAELLESGRSPMLGCFLGAALWSGASLLVLAQLRPMAAAGFTAYAPSAAIVGGGLLFGIGAAINRGCAFSTLLQLAEGQLSRLATLLGQVLGSLAWLLAGRPWEPVPVRAHTLEAALAVRPWVLVALFGLALAALVRYRDTGRELARAALLIGVTNGVLYALFGAWAYTTMLTQGVLWLAGSALAPSTASLLLVLALLGGMHVSAGRRSTLVVSLRGDWGRHFVGGLLMGGGGALIPGGNDELILRALPLLSPHAVPAYLALLAGIALVLLVERRHAP